MRSPKLSDQERADLALIAASELFDAEWYLATYPDVAAAGQDPAVHYLLSGPKDGRDPSPGFSTTSYLDTYADVRAAGLHPLAHFIRMGREEGRSPNPRGDLVAEIRESGLFDDEYYRFYRPDLPPEVDSIAHYLEHGADEGADPSEAFSTTGYLRFNSDVAGAGINPLLHFIREGRAQGRQSAPGRPRHRPVADLLLERFPNIAPFPVVRIRGAEPRITVVTDSVGVSSLFGGVGTALLLGITLANAFSATLRLVTRHDPPDAGVLRTLEEANGVRLRGDVEVEHLPLDGSRALLMGERDLLVTTSWWTTRSVLDSTVRKDEVLYLLQEDERMFYPYGDERLLCTETLAERGLSVVVNTGRLLTHLRRDYPDLHAFSFEPAFPGVTQEPPAPEGKRRFFFYSRPENARNLFWRGASVLAEAVTTNVLPPEEWAFYFVGRATPDLSLGRGVRPILVEGLPWSDYQALVAGMDAALVLMDTPHPSYPPLDLAAAGAAVLTNRHPGKEDLSDLSRNILSADLALPALLEGLREVARLGVDDEERARRRAADGLSRSWVDSLGSVAANLPPAVASRLGARSHVR